MRQVQCERCGELKFLNEAIRIGEQFVCAPCAKAFLEENPGFAETPGADIERMVDPTVCLRCGADNGDIELERVADLPLCPTCAAFMRRRPFPMWVKAAAVGIVAMMGWASVRSVPFFHAYRSIRSASRAFAEGRVAEADRQMSSAVELLSPYDLDSSRELKGVAVFYRGARELMEDRPADALVSLRQAKSVLGSAELLNRLLLSAEMGAAFDAGDYDAFLEKTEAMMQSHKNAETLLAVASALACKFAATGDESFRERSRQMMGEAMHAEGGNEESTREYAQRIKHRLSTRTIINRAEYQRRYPDGWADSEEESR